MLKNTQENIGHLMAVVFIDRSREKNAQGVDVDRTTEEVINRATIRGVFSNNFQITGVNPSRAASWRCCCGREDWRRRCPRSRKRAIGPTLGQDNINKGVNAMVFACWPRSCSCRYYKVFGLIADVVLVPTWCCSPHFCRWLERP